MNLSHKNRLTVFDLVRDPDGGKKELYAYVLWACLATIYEFFGSFMIVLFVDFAYL